MLLQWRWLVLFAGSLATIIFELYEGHHLTDPGFWWEVFLHGLLTPGIGWLLFTFLAHTITRNAKSKDQFDRHRRFTQQLTQRQAWSELTRFVTEFPGLTLSILRTSLYTYDHAKALFEFVAEWNSSGTISFGRPFVPEMCDNCPLPKLHRNQTLTHCQRDVDEYCLPLSCNNVLVGALQLKRRPGQVFTQDQVEFITAIAPEIALALALAIAFPRQMDQARASAQLDERRRITYDLHDSLAQQIGYLHLMLDRLGENDSVAQNGQLKDDLERMRVVAGEAYQRIRDTLALLRSHENSDLNQAIVEYANTVSQLARLHIEVTTVGEPTLLSPTLSQNVLNLVREGLNNVEKHAQATRAQIDLLWSAESLRLVLADNGIGFDPALASAEGHYGLTMVAERVNALRGELKIDSQPGKGTRLLFKIPLRRSPTEPNRKPPTERNHL